MPPSLQDWECPEGWRAGTLPSLPAVASQVCHPPLDPGPCAPGEIGWGRECLALGLACPDGSFLDDADVRALSPGYDGDILRVAAGEDVAERLALAEPGDVVHLGVGEHVGAFRVPDGVAVVGACVAGTVIRESSFATSGNPVVELSDVDSQAMLAHATVTGGRHCVGLADSGGRILLSRLRVSGCVGVGIAGYEGVLLARVEDVVVDGVVSSPDLGRGIGLLVEDTVTVLGARMVIESETSAVVGLGGAAIVSAVDSRLSARDSVATATDGASLNLTAVVLGGGFEVGVLVDQQGQATLTDVFADGDGRAESVGVLLRDSSSIEAFQLHVRDVTKGGVIVDGGSMTLDRAAVIGSAIPDLDGGSIVSQAGGSVVARNVLVKGENGFNLACVSAGLSVRDSVIVGRQQEGVRFSAVDTGACELNLERVALEYTGFAVATLRGDVAYSDVAMSGEAEFGIVHTGGRLTGLRLRVLAGDSGGIHLLDADASVLEDLSIECPGRGIEIDFTSAQLARLLVRGASVTALVINGGDVRASDVLLVDTQPDGFRRFGRGVSVQDGASLDAERVEILRNHQLGIGVFGGSSVRLRDATIAGTLSACQTCSEGVGTGIGVVEGAADVQRFELLDNELSGLLLASPEASRFMEGTIEGNGVGVHVANDVDLEDQFERVVLQNNGLDISFEETPIPSAAELLDGEQ